MARKPFSSLNEPSPQADSVEELRAAVRDAAGRHFEQGERPHLVRHYFVRDEAIAV